VVTSAFHADAEVQDTPNVNADDIPLLLAMMLMSQGRRRWTPGASDSVKPKTLARTVGALVLAALFMRLKRPTPWKKALVLAALSRGLKRPAPGVIVLVLAALSRGLKGQRGEEHVGVGRPLQRVEKVNAEDE
jgi:hypothetical protein